MPVTKVTKPQEELRIGRMSKPWKVYGRTLGIVILAFLLVQFLSVGVMGVLEGEPYLTACGILFSAPFLALIAYVQRPKIVDVRVAIPDPRGSNYHAIGPNETLWTPEPTRFRRHIVRDASSLDIPQARSLWAIFAVLITTSLAISLGLWTGIATEILFLIAIIIGIPFFLLGFSIPVMAWWAISKERLGILTRQRDAESWLFLGMMSGFPAIVINSFIFPEIAGILGFDTTNQELMLSLTAVISAPIGEEICKALAVAIFMHQMDGGKRGFQIGFTVGLGFALIENLQYILLSFEAGFTGFALTALIRGIGSIPGHAFWTGITGYAIGFLAGERREDGKTESEKPDDPGQTWMLFDPNTGQEIQPQDAASSETNALTSAFHQTLESRLQQISLPKIEEISGGIRPPSSIVMALMCAILGHGLWNGTAVFVPTIVLYLGGSEGASILASLFATLLLVVGVLVLGNALMRGVNGEDKEAKGTHIPTPT
jgi:RsiW-degrading membrane proteinase PrsW (M82 family)